MSDIRKMVTDYFPLLKINEHSVVLDFGANEGYFSRFCGELGAKVVAFEPNPWVFRNASVRLRDLPNVTLVCAAIGAQTSLAELYFPAEYGLAPELHSGSASLKSTNRAVEPTHSVQVLQIRVGEVLGSVDKVDLLKIDIEGSEGELWPELEASWEKIDYLAIETHESLLGAGEVRWLDRAQKFIALKNLGHRWRLDWP